MRALAPIPAGAVHAALKGLRQKAGASPELALPTHCGISEDGEMIEAAATARDLVSGKSLGGLKWKCVTATEQSHSRKVVRLAVQNGLLTPGVVSQTEFAGAPPDNSTQSWRRRQFRTRKARQKRGGSGGQKIRSTCFAGWRCEAGVSAPRPGRSTAAPKLGPEPRRSSLIVWTNYVHAHSVYYEPTPVF